MKVDEAMERIWLTYQVMMDAVKVASRTIRQGNVGLIRDTNFVDSLQEDAKHDLANCRMAAEEYAIISMWAIFERRLVEALTIESRKMLDSPPEEFNRAVCRKVEDSLEYMRANDILDLIKVLVGDDLAGKAKQIKRHRDWLAHRNKKKPSPANVQPVFVYQVLSEIEGQVSR